MGRGPAPLTDGAFLRSVAYADSKRLQARASIYRYREVPEVLAERVLEECDWPASARVLDVGCGPGAYLAHLRRLDVHAVGVDLSEGMCREASSHAPTAQADAARVPFPDAAFDRLLAPHMLYHCPDVPATVRELRRVLRPGGIALVVLNGEDHLHQLRALTRTVLGTDALALHERVRLETPELLAAEFDRVEVVRFGGRLLVPSADPVVAYVESLSGWAPDAPGAIAELRALVDDEIGTNGSFAIDTCAGVLVCR